MILLSIPFPDIDPIIFTIGSLEIRWYGFSYILGFVVGFAILRRLSTRGILPLEKSQVGEFLTGAMIGVIAGGRLGYVIFYKLPHYLDHPLEIVAIWDGGMSFHGGLLGVAIAGFLFCRKRDVPGLAILDAAAIAATPGLLFTRLANFINQELWGRPSDVPWAVEFTRPSAGGVPRHPSQIYEGLLEGAVLFVILWSLSYNRAYSRRGATAATFLVGYGCFRFVVEFYREPDRHLGAVLGPLSVGQLLSMGMIVVGSWGMFRVLRGSPSTA